MSIIYSYPTSQPTLDDLLIGTDVNDDNATKSFTVQSLVSLINAAQGTGIITDVTISTDAFISAVGNPTGPAVAYTIGLAATGTPSETTFLRGDNQWVVPTVTSGIQVSNNSSIVTVGAPLASMNFTGEGVDATSDSLGNVQISIPGAQNAIDEIAAGAGIGVSSPTGNVTISNTGILSIVPGTGITATTAQGVTTISATSSASGTVTSVSPGPGLRLYSESVSTADPIIGLNYGNSPNNPNDNYINQQDGFAVDADSIIPHYTQTGGNKLVYQTRLGDIPLSALTNINTAITDSATNVVKNDTDVSPFLEAVPKVDKVVTLTDAQYQTLIASSPLPADFANTLYLTTAAGAPPITQYQVFNSISQTISNPSGAAYTVTSTVADGASRTRASGTTESWSTSVSVNDPSSFEFTSLNISPASPQSVTYDSNKTINTSITGAIAAVTVPTCTAYLGGLDPNNAGNGIGATLVGKMIAGEEGVDYVITYSNPTNSLSGACTSPLTPSSSNFGVTYALIGPGDPGYVAGRGSDKYQIGTPIQYVYSGATTFNGTDPTCQITGSIVNRLYSINYTIVNQIDTDGSEMGTNYNLQNFGIVNNENDLTDSYSSLLYGQTVPATGTNVNAISPNAVSNIGKAPIGADAGLWDGTQFIIPPITGNLNFGLTLTGSSGASSFLVTAGTQTVNVGLNGGASFQYNLNGSNNWFDYTDPFSVPAGTLVSFAYTVLPDNGYFFFSVPVLSFNGSVVANGTNTGLLRTIFDSFTPTADTTRGPVSVTATTSANFPPMLVSSGSPNIGTQCGAIRNNTVYIRKGPDNTEPFYIQQNDYLYAAADSAQTIFPGYYSAYGPGPVEFYVSNTGKVGALSSCGPNAQL